MHVHVVFATHNRAVAITPEVGLSNLDQVRGYIANQAKHHRTATFEEEFVSFLRAHNIEFDERHLPQ
ncbi:MAG: hypothetical protein C4547_02345 [Phycisphaerales bacterium]|nr:MAG: hypothetical protein C4547_02345 [Phycisphaerales bacterium]